jgi:hypothetical protein
MASQKAHLKELAVQTCPEHKNLKRIYDDAVRAWQLHRILISDGSLKRAASLRKELLFARRQAAERLYEHSIHCRVCKRFRPSDEEP